MKATAFILLGFLTAGPLNPPVARAEANEFRITVDESGFNPPLIKVATGKPARLVFTRTTEKTCATKVVIPSLKISEDLPLNKPVTIDIKPDKSGKIGFACPMDMLKGKIDVTE